MKKFLGICICLAMFSAVGSVFAENEIETELTCSKYGHIFAEDNQTFKLNLQNTLSDTFDGKIQYSIVSDGESIYNMEKSVSIAPNGSYTDFPVLSCPEYGIFDLEVKVTDGTVVYGTDTIPFSFINGSAAGEGSEKMYVNTHIELETCAVPETVNAVRDAGFGGLRTPVYWFVVETNNKNEYKMPAFTENVKDAAEMGMEPLIVLTAGNGPWGCINEEEKNLNMAPSTDEQIQAFANYCAYVATNLKGYVKHYEIWNEFTMPSNGGDQSPAAYAKILVAASKAIKAVDPDAKIVAMCTAGMDWSFISGVTRQLRTMGESNCYDILSVHPYSLGAAYSTPNTTTLNLIKSLAGSKPIWFTERGWDTSTTVSSSTNGISDIQQAVYGVRDYLTLLSNNMCDRLFWYDFQDDGTDAAEREHNFGMIEAVDAAVPGAAKPAYVAFAAMNKLLGQATYKQVNSYTGGMLYSFTDAEGENLFALSGSVGSRPTVITGAGKYELLDMYSNVVEVYNSTGHINFTQTDEIMYIRKHYEPAGCEVKVSGGELLVSGHSMESDQPVSVMVSSVNGDLIYVGQMTCDDERAYSFTTDRKGINELYIRVNYGDLFTTSVETGFVLKLMCDGERVLSLEDITTTDNVKLVVSVNDTVTTATDVYAAVYNSDALKAAETITLQPGTAKGEYDIGIKIEEIADYDRISGFVWENMEPVTDNVDFE